MRQTRYYDDYQLGDVFVTDSLTVTEGQIMAYARAHDTQLFHTNIPAAGAGHFGGIIAGGFQTLSLSFALFFKLQLVQPVAVGGAGMEHVRWLKPLKGGDTMHMVCTVIGLKRGRGRQPRGTVRMRHDVLNQHDEIILTLECLHMMRARSPEETS